MYSLFNILVIFDIAWDFSDYFSFFPFFLFTLVVSMALKRKSTPARNLFHSGASSSSDPTLSHIRFRDDDAFKEFSENFSRRGIYSEHQVCRLPTSSVKGILSISFDSSIAVILTWNLSGRDLSTFLIILGSGMVSPRLKLSSLCLLA